MRALEELLVDVASLTPAQADGLACVLCGEPFVQAEPVGWCTWHGVRWCQVFACSGDAGSASEPPR